MALWTTEINYRIKTTSSAAGSSAQFPFLSISLLSLSLSFSPPLACTAIFTFLHCVVVAVLCAVFLLLTFNEKKVTHKVPRVASPRLASPSLALPYAALPLLQCVWAGALGGVAAAGVAKLSAELK